MNVGSAMERHAFVRWAGVAAIAGETLRGVTALLPAAQTPAIHLTYLAVDLLLLLGVVGLFTFQRERTGGWGAIGATLAVLGAGLLISDMRAIPNTCVWWRRYARRHLQGMCGRTSTPHYRHAT